MFWLLLDVVGGLSDGAASQALPCQETLGEGADLKLQQMVSAVFSL